MFYKSFLAIFPSVRLCKLAVTLVYSHMYNFCTAMQFGAAGAQDHDRQHGSGSGAAVREGVLAQEERGAGHGDAGPEGHHRRGRRRPRARTAHDQGRDAQDAGGPPSSGAPMLLSLSMCTYETSGYRTVGSYHHQSMRGSVAKDL